MHLHAHWLDGVYGDGGVFIPIAAPDRAEMAKLLSVIVKRIARLFARRSEGTSDIDEPAHASATDRAVRGSGVTRHGPEREDDPDTRDAGWKIKARIEDFDLDATTVVAPEKRDRLEPSRGERAQAERSEASPL